MRRSTPQHSSGTVEGYSPEPEREKFAGRWSEEPQVIYEEPDWGTFGSNQAATYDPRRTGPNPAAAIMAEADPIFGTGGTRMERRLAKRRAKRQRLLAILAITGLGLAVAITAAVILMGGKAKVAPGAGAANAARTVQAASLPAPVLLAHTNPAGGVDAMFVLAPGKTAGGGVALVPPGTLTEVPG
ncbi:MAG: hypothetical protein ACRD0E_07915, partial [Acidimicrobiales bacterium]